MVRGSCPWAKESQKHTKIASVLSQRCEGVQLAPNLLGKYTIHLYTYFVYIYIYVSIYVYISPSFEQEVAVAPHLLVHTFLFRIAFRDEHPPGKDGWEEGFPFQLGEELNLWSCKVI